METTCQQASKFRSGEQKAVVAAFPELCTPVLYSINFQIANWGTLDFTPTGSVVHPGVMIAGAGLRCGEDVLQTSRGVLQPPDLQRCPPASRPRSAPRHDLQPVLLCVRSAPLELAWSAGWRHHQGRGFTTFTFHFCDPLLTRLQTGARGADAEVRDMTWHIATFQCHTFMFFQIVTSDE